MPTPKVVNGSISFARINHDRRPWADMYHELLKSSWGAFIGWAFIVFALANLAFAAMDDVLRGALGNGVHTDGRRSQLTAPAPEGERVLHATLAVGDGDPGAVEIRLRRAA